MRELLGQPGMATTGDGAEAATDGGGTSPETQVPETAWDETDPTITVAEALAEAEGVEVTKLPPLFASIDTDALNALLSSAHDVRVSLTHLGYEVVVSGAGEVEVRHNEDD